MGRYEIFSQRPDLYFPVDHSREILEHCKTWFFSLFSYVFQGKKRSRRITVGYSSTRGGRDDDLLAFWTISHGGI